MNKWMPIFRTGTHTDSGGNTRTWTEKDLDAIASKYNPEHHEAPVVIGHPQYNAPAYGWVTALKREGQMLYAKLKDLVPAFVDMVRQGMFKKRSISLNEDGTLRHIGFLGAVPPAIKGLPDVAFSDSGGLTIEFEEGAGALNNRKEEKSMKFFEWLKGQAAKEGVAIEDMPQSFSEADVQARVDAAVKEKTKEFNEKLTSLDAEKAALKARENVLKQKEADAKKQAIASFCEDLRKKGILTSAMDKLGMGITEFMQQIASIETIVEFSEGDAKKNQTPLEFMQSFLGSLPKSIEFGEVAGNDKDAGKGGNAEKRDRLISEFMEKNKDRTYKDAFKAVASEHPELFQEEV